MDPMVFHMIEEEKRIHNQSYESQMSKLMDYFSIKDLGDETINAMIEDLHKAGADHLIHCIKLTRDK